MFLHSLPIFPTRYLLSCGVSYYALIQGVKISRVPIRKKKKKDFSWRRVYCYCCCSVIKLCPILCNPMDCSLPGFPVPHHLPEFAQVHLQRIGDTIQPSHPLLPSSPSAFNVSQHQGLSQWVSCSHQVASFSISPSKEYSGLISFNIDWFDLLTFHGTLRSLLPHHSLKASVLQSSAFFIVRLSHLYIRTRKTIALIIQTFIGKVMSLFSNTLSRFAIAFLPRSSHLLISWLRSPSAVILECKKRKSVTASTSFPPIYHKVMGPDAIILVFLSFKPAFSLSSFTLIKRLFSSSSLSAIRVVSPAISEVVDISLSNLDSRACSSSSPAFHMTCFTYKLNNMVK